MSILKEMLQNIINDKNDEAEQQLHQYLSGKMRDIMGTSTNEDEPMNEASQESKPMTFKEGLKLLKTTVAKKLGCEVKELAEIKSDEYGDISDSMKNQHIAFEAMKGKVADRTSIVWELKEEPEDDEGEEVEWDIVYYSIDGMTYASYGLQEGAAYTAQFLCKKTDLKKLTASYWLNTLANP